MIVLRNYRPRKLVWAWPLQSLLFLNTRHDRWYFWVNNDFISKHADISVYFRILPYILNIYKGNLFLYRTITYSSRILAVDTSAGAVVWNLCISHDVQATSGCTSQRAGSAAEENKSFIISDGTDLITAVEKLVEVVRQPWKKNRKHVLQYMVISNNSIREN